MKPRKNSFVFSSNFNILKRKKNETGTATPLVFDKELLNVGLIRKTSGEGSAKIPD